MTKEQKGSLHLLHRITNCLQTILELEPHLQKLEMGHSLLQEFDVLKDFLSKIDAVDLQEEDVERIEKATKSFLDELREPIAEMEEKDESSRILH